MLIPDSIDFKKDASIFKLKTNLFDINNFKCSNPEYEDYIKEVAYEDQEKSSAQALGICS